MDKKTLAFIVVSVVIIFVFFNLQDPFGANKNAANATAQSVATAAPVATPTPTISPMNTPVAVNSAKTGEEKETVYKIETDVLSVSFSDLGGDITSIKMREHKTSDGAPIEMIIGPNARAFSLSFGNQGTTRINSKFEYSNAKKDEQGRTYVEFSSLFSAKDTNSGENASDIQFKLVKRYTFAKGEYAIKFDVTILGLDGKEAPALSNNGIAYSIFVGPQTGPKFTTLDGTYEYRNYYGFENGNRSGIDPKKNDFKPNTEWASVCSKYFATIARAYSSSYDNNRGDNVPCSFAFNSGMIKNETGNDFPISEIYLLRNQLPAHKETVDTYYYYFGPKTDKYLTIYNNSNDNAFGIGGQKFDSVVEAGKSILGWLENILKFFLELFYLVIPNWGVSIIFVTLLFRVLFFPLTFKGSMATTKMQALTPKINELREKYKDNPKKMNEQMAELYKKEKANPLSGCLPMLLQLPLYFAMYSLFNNQFDFRGALFIPGWVPDLSIGDSVMHWNVGIPILGWTDIRLLPMIYVASQLLYGKFTSTPNASQSAKQMKFMMFGLPIIFFFILYNAPSGLVLYWIASNLLTIVQQIVINNLLKKRKQVPVVVPTKFKK